MHDWSLEIKLASWQPETTGWCNLWTGRQVMMSLRSVVASICLYSRHTPSQQAGDDRRSPARSPPSPGSGEQGWMVQVQAGQRPSRCFGANLLFLARRPVPSGLHLSPFAGGAHAVLPVRRCGDPRQPAGWVGLTRGHHWRRFPSHEAVGKKPVAAGIRWSNHGNLLNHLMRLSIPSLYGSN